MPTRDSNLWQFSRRELLQRSGLGLGALGLMHLLQDDGRLAAADEAPQSQLPLAQRPAHFPGRAKRVVHFFLNGGPSHVDTFDPKPALARYAGQSLPETLTTERKTGAAFPSPFKFRRYGQSGLEISEIFSRTAEHADDIAVIRSMYAQVPNHEPSLMLMNCGDSAQPRPSVGSWVLYGMGTENQNLPGFIAMCPGGLPIKDAENWQAAFLPGAYQGTYVDSQHQSLGKLIENIEHPQIERPAQRRQLDLLAKWNAEHRAAHQDPRLDARIHAYELAFMMQRDAREAFDISRETAETLQLYGIDQEVTRDYGTRCLIARRLVERGVRFVQIFNNGQSWDHHSSITTELPKRAQEIDRPAAALVRDLKRRGLLDSTLVHWGGEMGRLPTVQIPVGTDGTERVGRDHNTYGFSMWVAGGGLKRGCVYGKTDEFSHHAVEDVVTNHDWLATVLHLFGLSHQELKFRVGNRSLALVENPGASVVHGLLA